ENMVENSRRLGEYMRQELRKLTNPLISEIRGKGLFVGVELASKARPYCEALKDEGLLCKETHENVVRFAPPLVITKEELDWGLERIRRVFS
ncbi:MAG: aminotransferase class III-fold pyridoxal phosphate-dependent enzyme, partial [Candidatus Bipolaricaulota bacterium]